MNLMKSNLFYDIVILGAGPAGTACALALKDSALKVALIDKASFPRDKVCGDAIPGPAVRILRAISPATSQRFDAFQHKRLSRGGTAIAPNHTAFSIQFQTEGYIFIILFEGLGSDFSWYKFLSEAY